MGPNAQEHVGFLSPYRVLDLADEKGVFCTKLLADYGADVIRVEPSGEDPGRSRGPFLHDLPHPETSLYFLFYNTNKRSITLNLETAAGQEIFRRLAQTADVVVETFPVGYLEELGLGYEGLKETNQGLVMASITPFGQTGPWKGYKSSDLVAMAASGYMQITGDPAAPPLRLGNEHSHFPGAQYAAVAILGALYYRDILSGTGQHIDVSLQEALITYYTDAHPALAWMQRQENVTRVGTNSTLVVPLEAYPCKDGWISTGIITAREWDTLAQWMYEVTGSEEVLEERYRGGTQERAPNMDIVTAMVMDFTSRFTAEELFHEGQSRNLVFIPGERHGRPSKGPPAGGQRLLDRAGPPRGGPAQVLPRHLLQRGDGSRQGGRPRAGPGQPRRLLRRAGYHPRRAGGVKEHGGYLGF